MKGFPDLPPLWLAGFALLGWALARILPLASFSVPYLGSLLFAAGAALIVWAVIWFVRRKTPVEPHHTPKVLLAEGPFAISRNPIYLGMVLILTGLCIGWGAVSALIVIPAFIAVIQRRFVLKEEAVMRATFGAEADAYFTRTRRWI